MWQTGRPAVELRTEEHPISNGQLHNAAIAVTPIIAVSPLAAEPVALRGYNAAIGESSISGISSGAFMAVQFGTAWSSVIKGVGVIAGGPYWCAKADNDGFMHEGSTAGPEHPERQGRCQGSVRRHRSPAEPETAKAVS